MKTLLRNYINQEKCPAELYKNTTDSVSAIASATASLACKFVSVTNFFFIPQANCL